MINLDYEYLRSSEVEDSSLQVNKNSAHLNSENNLQKSTTIEFLKTLYNYPPNFHLKLENSQKPNYKNTGKISIEKRKYTPSDYINGFKCKIKVSDFLQTQNDLLTYFNSVPVYVILNGSGEIVLGKTMLNNFSQIGKKSINEKIYNFCGAFEDGKVTRESNLGLFFLNKKDAEIYMKELIIKDIQGVGIQGVSIHCTSLVSAYRLMCEHHPGFDFRFVPDIQEVISLMETNRYTRNTMAVINSSNEPLDLILEKLDQLKDPITSFYWDHLANSDNYPNLPINYSKQNDLDAWSGTPIYFVNLPHEKTTTLFLSYSKAKNYLNRIRKKVRTETVNKGYSSFETFPIAKNSAIQVANLENFFDIYLQTKLPMPEFSGRYDDQKEIPFNVPYRKKWQQTILRKCRIINSFWSTMLYS